MVKFVFVLFYANLYIDILVLVDFIEYRIYFHLCKSHLSNSLLYIKSFLAGEGPGGIFGGALLLLLKCLRHSMHISTDNKAWVEKTDL